MTPDTPPTSNDVPVTDELVDALVNEAERGYDVGKLRGRGLPNASATDHPKSFQFDGPATPTGTRGTSSR